MLFGLIGSCILNFLMLSWNSQNREVILLAPVQSLLTKYLTFQDLHTGVRARSLCRTLTGSDWDIWAYFRHRGLTEGIFKIKPNNQKGFAYSSRWLWDRHETQVEKKNGSQEYLRLFSKMLYPLANLPDSSPKCAHRMPHPIEINSRQKYSKRMKKPTRTICNIFS